MDPNSKNSFIEFRMMNEFFFQERVSKYLGR